MQRAPRDRQKTVRAGCALCELEWTSANAQAIAAKHHDKTGHQTFAEIRVVYGGERKDLPGQTTMFGGGS